MLKRCNAQAMTEFVLVLPVFLLLLAGMYQLSLLSLRRIELAMVEREVMRYVTADAEEKDADKVRAFAAECAGKLGMQADKLGYEQESMGIIGMEKVESFGLLDNLQGIRFKLTYEEKLSGFFAAVMKRECVTLTTKLYTAAGSSFKFKPAQKAREIWDGLTKGGGK